ncbi:hypothetical protein MMC11_006391 [Xylographa trunciseda]|nr:hypothetical protein [Xylographa trunciseda]
MLPLVPHLNSQSVYIACESPQSPEYHVVFITGNPGCIGYYHSFLSLLADKITKKAVHIYGHSLANFVDESRDRPSHSKILGLQEQIDHIEERLKNYVNSLSLSMETDEAPKQSKIILVGHSVGAYIGLELLKRWREREKLIGNIDKIRFCGYVGLWPTVTWIEKSPSGLKLGVGHENLQRQSLQWMAFIPNFPQIISSLMKVVAAVIPQKALLNIVKFVARMPDEAANVTLEFLCSHKGVHQALYLARDEMQEITEDRWDEDLWGTNTVSPYSSKIKLVFYFGKSDHWVADHIRDELIKTRAAQEGDSWKPKMIIDDEDIPHGFCIRHSSIAAIKTAAFVEEIIAADKAQINHLGGQQE